MMRVGEGREGVSIVSGLSDVKKMYEIIRVRWKLSRFRLCLWGFERLHFFRLFLFRRR